MTRPLRQPRDLIAEFPRLRLTPQQFDNLSDYSASYPTGTTPGKMWRRLDGAFDRAFIQSGGQPYWMVMQYDPAAPSDPEIEAMKARGEPVPTRISILRFKPVIVLRADARPSAAEVAA
ncbi:hypothetical protein [Methylobacterium brachiatum]|uniref:hypothetical protein n=1 Tax=Methylobacterium brachiatum TaxID=269660 RepID=UPI002446DA69|nr:hypothetical protein [Methylobacterium brachiatum]MDH2313081.1 hypothetical protein [Methylobacterium brachiatum]